MSRVCAPHSATIVRCSTAPWRGVSRPCRALWRLAQTGRPNLTLGSSKHSPPLTTRSTLGITWARLDHRAPHRHPGKDFKAARAVGAAGAPRLTSTDRKGHFDTQQQPLGSCKMLPPLKTRAMPGIALACLTRHTGRMWPLL